METNELYTADVTRTLPINGTFSPLQRKIYDAVYEARGSSTPPTPTASSPRRA
ncbi:hypothetical protein SMICM304S_03135 [Streptomyces microflavus]